MKIRSITQLSPSLCGVICLCAGLAVACKQGETDTPGPDASNIVPVAVTRVQTGTLVRKLGYVGDIEGESEIRVFSSIPDRIISLPVKEGDRVKKGQIVGVIKSSKDFMAAFITFNIIPFHFFAIV